MTRTMRICAAKWRDEAGATLVEFAIVMGLFLFLLFGLIDFARLSYSVVMAEKATEAAVRMAVVRPVVCEGVPVVTRRSLLGTLAINTPNGTRCSDAPGVCEAASTVTCTGSADQPQAAEIWARLSPLLPGNATVENLAFSYSYDPDLNRVGARYAPVVTVDIVDLDFHFISPLGALAAFAGASGSSDLGESFTFPTMSASLPSEDLS